MNVFSRIKKQPKVLLIFLIFFISGFFFYKNLVFYALIIFLAASLEFFSYKFRLRPNFGHVFFLSIIVTRQISFIHGVILLGLAELLPRFVMADIDLKYLIIFPIEILFVFISSLFITQNIFFLGIIISFLNYVLYFIVAKVIGDSLLEIAVEIGLAFIMNLVYFVSLAGPISLLIANVIGA